MLGPGLRVPSGCLSEVLWGGRARSSGHPSSRCCTQDSRGPSDEPIFPGVGETIRLSWQGLGGHRHMVVAATRYSPGPHICCEVSKWGQHT